MKRLFSFNTPEDALAAFRKAKERKRQWKENVNSKLEALEREILISEGEYY